jgi:hypothetical protein
MEERSFKRAVLFGVLGALVFMVLGAVLVHFIPVLKDTLVFRSDFIKLNLHLVAIHIRINLFVLIGFIVGWAVCLFRRT